MTETTQTMTRTRRTLAAALAALLPLGLTACEKPNGAATATNAADTSTDTSAENPAGNGETKAPGLSAKRYTHDVLEFSLAFPETWTVKKDFENRFALFGSSPKESEEDLYAENVNVMAMTTPKDMSLEDFAATQLKMAREVLDTYARRGSSFEEINGHKAARFDYAHSVDNLRLVSITFILVNDGIAYAITCSTTLDDYDRYRRTLNEVARSFRFTDE